MDPEIGIVEIPAPLGETYCHRYRNGTIEHHEAPWKDGMAFCERCGIKARLSFKSLDSFLNDADLRENLFEKE